MWSGINNGKSRKCGADEKRTVVLESLCPDVDDGQNHRGLRVIRENSGDYD